MEQNEGLGIDAESFYSYKSKHKLCIAFGFWINYPVSTETTQRLSTDGGIITEKYMTSYWELTWKPPFSSESSRITIFRYCIGKSPVKTKKEELQFLFDSTEVIEIDIS